MNPGEGLGRGILEVVMAIISISLITLLLNKSEATTQVIQSGSSALDTLLKTVTLQNGMGSMAFQGQ
jgi:hypothetical protein